jgi:predicted DNA-binding transcriptional regulator AlpA
MTPEAHVSSSSRLYVTFTEIKEVLGVTWSREHIRRLIKKELFAAPYEMSPKRIAWRYSELLDWAKNRQSKQKPSARRVVIEEDEHHGVVS